MDRRKWTIPIAKDESISIIPTNKLSAEALKGVIEEFISRGGTDDGGTESSMDTRFRHVKNKLENGSAVLIYDDRTETTNILLSDDPVLKKLCAPKRQNKD